MIDKILAKVFSVIRRMNQWWDKDEDKEVAAVISGIIFLLAILILKKPILFIGAFILILNRVIHRFNLWTTWECKFGDCVSSSIPETDIDELKDVEISMAEVEKMENGFDDPDSITESEGEEKDDEPEK